MANGTEPEKFVVLSKVRTGLKREFEFAMKAQSEICGGSLSRTRSRKPYSEVLNNGSQSNFRKKKRKSGGSERVVNGGLEEVKRIDFDEKLVDDSTREEAKNNVVDDDDKNGRRECVMGLSVSGELKRNDEVGDIENEGEFRVGKCGEGPISIDDSVNLKNMESEERPVRRFTRSALKLNVEPPAKNVETNKASQSAMKSNVEPPKNVETNNASSSVTIAVVNDGVLNAVIVPKSVESTQSGSLSVKSAGKLTRKFLQLHKLVFKEGVLPDGAEISYFVRGKKILLGYKKNTGILCSCCNSEISPSQFEAHAGWAQRRKPFHNIYTSNGVSLHELAVSLSQDPNFFTQENDELCSICHDGGDLMCCDTCPRAYHVACVPLQSIPAGKWSCRFCENTFHKESFVSHNANAIAAGRVEGVDPIEQITKRLIRIVETPDVDVGGCTLCRGHGFSKSGFGPGTVMICDQCEREFHVGCLKEHEMADLKELPPGKWFCCTACDTIHSALEKLIDDGEQKLLDSSLDCFTKKQSSEEEEEEEKEKDLDISWRILNWKMKSDDVSRDLLSKAVDIFHDQFTPISNSPTAKAHDLTHSMVFGKKIKEHDFGGMYCAILTVNQVVVSTGIFRIFGRDFAELPLVATITKCQGKGYFRVLYDSLEKLLGRVNVKTLVLPAANEVESIWTNKFGFNIMDLNEVHKFKRDYPMMTFSGTSVLQKAVPVTMNE